MNPHDEAKQEQQIASLLAATQTGAPPPDPEMLARLRAQSTEAFALASHRAREQQRRRVGRALRWIGSSAAAVLILAVSVFFLLLPSGSGVALGKVLDDVNNADTLHLRFSRTALQVDFWHTSKPNRSRWDEPGGKSQIADGATLWIVNEKANQVRRVNRPLETDRPLSQFLVLLGLPENHPALLNARPTDRIRDGDLDLVVYTTRVLVPESVFWLEARVDAATHRLHSMRTWRSNAGNWESQGQLTVLGLDEPLSADKFAIADTLTEDGRIGKVADVQGIVTIKPVLHSRWTPVREGVVLRPGDWVRTDARGANATALRLVKQTGVILGPKTLVELIGPTQVRLIEGEVEITPAAGSSIDLLGPDDRRIAVKGKQLFRAAKGRIARLQDEPRWLAGFKGAAPNETLGSLVALIDGRNVPLTVGYHKVSVDIRDQIARTVIEESFVNHTDAQLEGVFHFPLPQDASISGFGMWIGDKLVEADVVEKQRAREIYETILRERRDPGLLEWTGGNIFKARVFPIFPHSEKRIKITYTQVLPLKGSRYRYSYALQSELLQQHPLRELAIDVRVNSAVPLKSVTSPTHTTRNDATLHSAHVEFTAQEYTPTRDFEVVVELGSGQSDAVLIPHRRGDDGYFMLQLTPPGGSGDWERPLLPDGEPVQLLILADTSASIDAGQRATQATFIGALLSSLTAKDTFNLATCDVTCDWAFAEPVPASAENVAAARDYLAKRTSLGWTDLDRAFATAFKRAGPKTHVVYVGDGIVTTGDADPVAFSKRLRRLYDGSSAILHSVSLGSSYEPRVLKAIAALSGGSMRKITGEQGPQAVARELLGEIAQPALRDIKVEFKGMKVARVYPETLANVPSGSQQILLGRYLPEGKDQTGEVIVTGTQASKPVRFSTHVSLKDAEEGNSFIPRLWARMHLDSLLEQGTSEVIRDEIIALSEEYQIITPYTSLLVLETDADRERFKVTRRFRMRDGERFFADGRDNAVFDLAQKNIKRAAVWRTALRRSVLRELARLGREPRLFQDFTRRQYSFTSREYSKKSLAERHHFLGDLNGIYDPLDEGELRAGDIGGVPPGELGMPAQDELREEGRLHERAGDLDLDEQAGRLETAPAERLTYERISDGTPEIMDTLAQDGNLLANEMGGDFKNLKQIGLAVHNLTYDGELSGKMLGRVYRGPYYGQWLNTLFPPLHRAPGETKEPKSIWPAAARDLARSLLRKDQLAKLIGGLGITRQTESFDPRWGDLTGRSRRLEVVGAKAWATRSDGDGGQTIVSWCDGKEIGIFSQAFQLGRVRAAVPRDVQPPPLELGDYSLASLEQSFAGYTPVLEPQGKDRTSLRLKHPSSTLYETRILIDTARHVVLSIENRYRNKVTDARKFDDFVEVAGSWWARRIEATDADGKRVSLTTQAIKTLTAAELDQQMHTALAGRPQIQFVHLPLPTVSAAKKAAALGKAGFDDEFVLLLHFHHSQQWARALTHLQGAEKLAAGKPGLRWLHSALLRDSRRHEELRRRYQEEAARLGKESSADAYFLAEHIAGQSSGVLEASEMLTLLEVLRPLYERQPAHVQAAKRWQQLRVSYLNQAGRTDEALKVQRQLAADYPRDLHLQQQYATALAGAGDYPAAYAWLTRVLTRDAKWRVDEADALRSTYARLLEQQGRYTDLAAYLAESVAQDPPGRSTYEQYLSALIRSDQIEKADALALRWLKEAQELLQKQLQKGSGSEVPVELPAAAAARLEAAVYLMLGNGYQLSSNRVEERWLAPLAQAAVFFIRSTANSWIADHIVGNHHFQRSDEGKKLHKTFAGILSGEIDKLSGEEISRLARWVDTVDLEPAAWDRITAVLRQRWTKEPKDEVKHALGQGLVSLLSRHDRPDDTLAFLRLQRETGPEKHRTDYTQQLFDRLLEQPWKAEYEAEAFTLFDKLSDAEDPGARLFSAVAALHRLTDKLLEARFAAGMKALEHAEKLTRTELHKKQEESRRQAREQLADRLRQEAAKHPKALARWLTAESLYLDLVLDRNLKQAAAEAWEVVGAAPPAPPPAGAEPSMERALERVLQQRYLVTLANLALRKGAEPALVERLLKYLDLGISAGEPGASATGSSNYWRLSKYRLLIALDRTKELEQALTQWTRQDDPDNRWRVALGYLLAEHGRVPEAIREFEAVEADDELFPAEYRALADWYLVQGQREAHERAAAAVYRTAPEYRLHQMLAMRLQPWQREGGHLPTELDPEVLRLFAVLFEKSASPQNYLYQLQQFYDASHDFRLLTGLADAVIGHTASRAYPFVQGMQSVLNEVRDEATADEIVKRIGEVRPRAKTVVDQRALDMLEVLVERRAAELKNQPGPHRDRALAALVRAGKRQWSPGEPRLMADYLAGLGAITQTSLADEQLRQLQELHAAAERGSQDRLHIACRHALTLSGAQRRAAAIDLLQAALDEFAAANAGVLPVSANSALASFIGLLEDAGHFVRGEKLLLAQMQHPVHAQQRQWHIERLNELYHHALRQGGEVSLGKGRNLYQALDKKLQKDIAQADQNHRARLIMLLCSVYRTAVDKKLPNVTADVTTFAFEVLPPLLKLQTSDHESVVSTVAHTVRDLAGPKDGIAFLLNELDSEPRWLRYSNQDAWSRLGTTLAEWRLQAKALGDVEDRLLKRVLAELRRDLETRNDRMRPFYYRHQDVARFWKEKAADFARVAEDVLAQRSQSEAAVMYIADYFYWGLDQPKRAIEILAAAHQRKLLYDEGQVKLVEYLHRQDRYAESIPVLEPLLQRRPEYLEQRLQLMHAYFRTGRKTDLLALLRQTDAFFHDKDRWSEAVMARLAESTLQNELYEQSIAYYKEVIPLHERTQPGRGVAGGTLSNYYTGLANAYAGLGKTPEAVDAAGAAIVAWGPRRDQRAAALDTLLGVLLRSPDLDAYVAHLDRQKQDSAVIRKALGQAYRKKNDHARAIKQLELAAELQPGDAEIHQLLVASLDAIGNREGAVRQLLKAVQLARRDLKLYEDLGQRYAATGQQQEAERAYTSIVEVQPTESESHALLAEVRQKQDRWRDAIEHWQQVARLRALEPTGLLKLAAAQIHEKQWDQAEETLRKLDSRTWPPRFGEVRHQVRTLQEQLARERAKAPI
jgi:Flp pilus assembly protein TadD